MGAFYQSYTYTDSAMSNIDLIRSITGFRERELASRKLLIAEGKLVTERLLGSKLEVRLVVCTPELEPYARTLVNTRCEVQIMPEKDMSELAGYAFHRGILAIGTRPAALSFEDFLSQVPKQAALPHQAVKRVIVCPDVHDPQNLGALFRNAKAFGWQAVALGKNGVSPWSRRAIRVSMGAVFDVPVLELSGKEDLATLGKHAYLRVGTSAAAAPDSLDNLCLQLNQLQQIEQNPQALALVFGNEFSGLASDWAKVCDRLCSIPMSEGHDSLNVATSAAIFMYRLGR